MLKLNFWRLKFAFSCGDRYLRWEDGKKVKCFRHYFSPRELRHFRQLGVYVKKIGGIFMIIFPKYSLTDEKASPWLNLMFRLEEPIKRSFPFKILGDFIIAVCKK
jgi:hypothetical protein